MSKNTVTIPSCSVIIFLVIPAFELEVSKFLVAIETYFPIVSISIIPSFVLNWISVNCHPKTQETSSLLCTPGTLVHGLNETSCGNKGNSIWKSSFNLINKDSRNDWQMKGPYFPYLILLLPPSHSLTPLHRINAGPLPLTNIDSTWLSIRCKQMVYLPPQFLVPETASSSLSLPEAGTLALITHLTASGKDSRRPHFLRPHEPLELLTINRQNCTITEMAPTRAFCLLLVKRGYYRFHI